VANLSELIVRRVVPVQQPVAGAELSITPQGLGAWQILNLLFTLATSAVVANRQVQLVLDDGTTTVWRTVANVIQAASLTTTYQASANVNTQPITGNFFQMQAPQEGILLRRGWRLRTITAAIDVADQYSAVSMWVQENPDGPDFVVDPTMLTYAALANG
jgi:hypothetical protein